MRLNEVDGVEAYSAASWSVTGAGELAIGWDGKSYWGEVVRLNDSILRR